MEQPDRRLEVVCEQLEIYDLFNLYGEALDHEQWGLLDSVFSGDVSATWFGRFERRGRDDVVSFVRMLLRDVSESHHLFGNYTSIVCGNAAEASVRTRAYFRGSNAADGHFLDTIGSLAGELVLTRDGWRFERLDHDLTVIAGTRDLFPPEPELGRTGRASSL